MDSATYERSLQVPRTPKGPPLQIPAALIVVVVGLLWTMVRRPALLRTLQLGPSLPYVVVPSHQAWLQGDAHSATSCILHHQLIMSYVMQ